MPQWHTIEELTTDILREFEAERTAGGTEEAAVVRASALLAMHRDDIASPNISYGLTVAVLRSVLEIVDPHGTRH